MRRVFFCIALTVAVFVVQAQGMDKNHHIEFYGGVGFPVGSFGKPLFGYCFYEEDKQATLDFHGAKLGASYGFVADFYVISDYFGVLININGSSHSLQEAKMYPGEHYAPVWKTTVSGNWNSIQALLGITARYPVVDWLLFTGRAAVGYSHLVVPFFSAEADAKGVSYYNSLTTPSKGGFGYLAGIGLQFCITSSFGIHLRGDYSGSSVIMFNGGKSAESAVFRKQSNELLPEGTTAFEFQEAFQAVSVNIGLSLAF
jgi:hypothetical protein